MKKIIPILLLLLIVAGCVGCSGGNDISPRDAQIVFTVPATEDIVMYEINIGSFSDNGDLKGITARLDNIEALGINTVWLMPIYPVGTVNSFGSPYCVKDYLSVNAQFGSFQDLKTLVSEAHQRNIAVILDWVGNHTAWDNSWITSHPEWYTHDSSGNIISPEGTNWTDVADLNYNNNQMRQEMISSMSFWITEAGIDGFRCDAADMIPFDFWQQSISSLKTTAGRNIILLAEGSRADHFTAGFQMNFAWDWYNTLKNIFVENGAAQTLNITNLSEYSQVLPGNQKLRFTTNHDLSNEATPVEIFGSQQAALAASVATIFMNGTPLIYSGQEVGTSLAAVYSSGQVIDWNSNPEILASYTKLLQFYKNSNAAKSGTLAYFNDLEAIIFEKTYGNDKLLVIVNSRSTEKILVVPQDLQGSWRNISTNETLTLSGNLYLTGYDYLVLEKI